VSAFIARGHKNAHKLNFYSRHAFQRLLPAAWLRAHRESIMRQIDAMDEKERFQVLWRINYYNKLESSFSVSDDATRIRDFKRGKSWAYYLDMLSILRFFPRDMRFHYQFGDITRVPSVPTFVKSRPVGEENHNAVLLKLNRVRHYYMVNDRVPFGAKESKVVWRGACHQPQRQRFIEGFHDHPLCNVGDVHRKAQGKPWHREFMSVADQLQYKFVLSIEGNDVATNLKWIMASNSLCFMTKPRYETWFMEGALVPGHHFVELKSDYSDLEEKIRYYTKHDAEAKAIIANANDYVEQFKDEGKERLLNLAVMQKFFKKSNQIDGVF